MTFLDTPGHAAFSAMRSSGCETTDVVVLVIAADDGVNEQTKEVIKMALKEKCGSKSKASVIVAVTKIDKEGVRVSEAVQRIETELSGLGIVTESFGGDVAVCPVSGITGEGVDKLIENLVLIAEMQVRKRERPAKIIPPSSAPLRAARVFSRSFVPRPRSF